MTRNDRATGTRRLLELAALLDSLPPERFDYRTWVGDTFEGDPDLSCGTTACALGWATTMPELRAAGLHLACPPQAGWWPVCGLATGYEAACPVFGVRRSEAYLLFVPGARVAHRSGGYWTAPGEHATAGEVAEHIREFLRVRDELVPWGSE